MLGGVNLNYDELITAVTEMEDVINLRSLLYILSDNLDESMTPVYLFTIVTGCSVSRTVKLVTMILKSFPNSCLKQGRSYEIVN